MPLALFALSYQRISKTVSLKKNCRLMTLEILTRSCRCKRTHDVTLLTLTNPPISKPTKNRARITDQKSTIGFFFTGPTACLQSNRRKTNQRKIHQRKTGFAKGRSVVVPVKSVGFPSVRPKMIGGFDGKIRPLVFIRYEGRLVC